MKTIELTRPPSEEKPQLKEVFTPSSDFTENRLWRFAKAHVSAHDFGHHELVSPWSRTYCSVEPYIIAANRQLSAMHPIYRRLNPHLRYKIKMNALARQGLINAGGIIESSFSPRKYSMELSSPAYGPGRFAEKRNGGGDPEAEHGLRLVILDYPFAADGLLVWSAITDWVSSYFAHYYAEPSAVVDYDKLRFSGPRFATADTPTRRTCRGDPIS
ncbi:hypothetical protein HPP92_019175 [Vanilla planifolia]|uniref:Lipoxygenase domain-containing protein n=1 Tax=Vanilla planifolia TaxID=51239 RepID=A0A835UMN5_VANPL|nr:hypothetical protein HPP92_019175 [Vanilla planifolia]